MKDIAVVLSADKVTSLTHIRRHCQVSDQVFTEVRITGQHLLAHLSTYNTNYLV